MKNRFLIYAFQFDRNDGQEKAFNTTMIGEVKPSEDEYKGLTDEQAVIKRVKAELGFNKNRGCEQPYAHIVNLKYFEFWANCDKGADKKIHAVLEKRGFPRIYVKKWENSDKESTTEEFNFNEKSEQFSTIIYNIILDLEGKKKINKFKPRDNAQKEAIEKMLCAFKAGCRSFLLGAICRFGKSAVVLNCLTERMNLKNILVITAKCDAFQSWETDYDKFVDRSWQLMTKKEILSKQKFYEKNIAVVSFQSAAKDYEDDDEQELADSSELLTLGRLLTQIKWDAVVIDECHFGSSTPRSRKFLEKINAKYTIDVSATPYKKLLRGEYSRDNAFIYDLIDEAHAHAGVNDYSIYVPMPFYHLDFGNAGCKISSFLNKGNSRDKKKQDIDKFGNCFKNRTEDDVVFDFRAYFEQFSPETIRFHFDMMYKNIFSKVGKNYAVFVNNIAHGNKLEDALGEKKYKVINVCGSSKLDINRINNLLDNSEKPVIIISCGRDLTGVTTKRLHGLIIMGTLHSAENYIQYSSRGKNPYVGRDCPCSVFDLNTNSFIQTDAFIQYVECRRDFLKQTTETTIEEIGECFEIFEIDEAGIFSACDNVADQIKQTMLKLASRTSGGRHVDYFTTLLTETDKDVLLQILPALSLMKTDKKSVQVTITEDETAGKVERMNSKNKNKQIVKKADFNKAIEKMRTIARILPQLMLVYNVNNINEFSNKKNLQTLFFDWTDAEWIGTMQIVHDYLQEKDEIFKWEELNNALCEAKLL